jgi:hypothetical protein
MRCRLLPAFYLSVDSVAPIGINSHACVNCAISLEDANGGPFRNETVVSP